ncbi:kinase-like domain-containing protein [Amylocarpus encephaloides]|uniref:non-specific serine/threonine protein kinase n=1 Tax=Amylocarpus encephaloides TaxID=45428 RepID=A0A9P7YT36_9HELO|nr:kinase-like domain-containing protein [Amylocarpus encephaloides]
MSSGSVFPRYIPRDHSEGGGITSSIQVLRTRDNTAFLASKIPDVRTKDAPLPPVSESDSDSYSSDGESSIAEDEGYKTKLADVIIPTAGVAISHILNHPNLISLVDIVQNSRPGASAGPLSNLTVWEDMNAGCLAYLVPSANFLPSLNDAAAWHALSAPNYNRFSLPESLCWHVLRSISRALLWLHTGYKEDVELNWQKHDEDWHPILIRDVSPEQIWFKRPDGRRGETFGECKLGGFQWAKVTGTGFGEKAETEEVETAGDGKRLYWPPEIYNKTAPWIPATEIWSLGAVIYHMMTGMTPPRQYEHNWQISRMNDKGFSDFLRPIVGDMLKRNPEQRPGGVELLERIEEGWRAWRGNTKEGLEFVDKDDEKWFREDGVYGGV